MKHKEQNKQEIQTKPPSYAKKKNMGLETNTKKQPGGVSSLTRRHVCHA
jgi:hypothetical protein